MKDAAELIRAVAALLWPILAFAVAFGFKPQIANFLKRLRKGKFFGQEVELDEELLQLQTSVVAAEKEVAVIPRQEVAGEENASDDPIAAILAEASKSPKIALMMLGAEIEKRARDL